MTQNKANYKKEETSTNKMTYPLPPYSTVIGAVHSACSFTEYHPMQVSVQGRFGAMQMEPHVNTIFLNSLQNDRGILVKLHNEQLQSNAIHKVAEAIKNQGNDFEKEITIRVLDRELLTQFQTLKVEKREVDLLKKEDETLKTLTDKLKECKNEQKPLDKKSERFLELKEIISVLQTEKKNIELMYKTKLEAIDFELKKFATMVSSLKYYEILHEVSLVLHIQSDEKTMEMIVDNIHHLKSIGRSEDFVSVQGCKLVELAEEVDDELESNWSGYVKAENVTSGHIVTRATGKGTKYYLNKDYTLEKHQRIFQKYWVHYADGFSVDADDTVFGEETGIYVDEDCYIVNFV